MKLFVENHEAIIEFYYCPQAPDAVHGETVPHKPEALCVYFYYRQPSSDEDSYSKIRLSKTFILDIAKKIEDLEGLTADMPFEELPF
jgi:hypothetical protein